MKGFLVFLRNLVLLALVGIVILMAIAFSNSGVSQSVNTPRATMMCIKDSTGTFSDVWIYDVDDNKIVAIDIGARVEVINKNDTDAIIRYGGKRYGTPLKNLETCRS